MTEARPTVLAVDDTAMNVHILLDALGDDYRVRVATDGFAALEDVTEDPPDLILLDVMMPGLDGFEVCRRLKEDPVARGIPIVFLTSLSEDAEEARGLALGAADFITKPFNPDIVKARVRNQIELKAHRDHLEVLVAERTHELAKANERLLERGRLKDDFLRMISHEVRTPANGVLGIGELIMDLCPLSDDFTAYRDLFRTSSLRLCSLIDDVTMIAEIEKAPLKSGAPVPSSVLLDEVRASLGDMHIPTVQQGPRESVFLQGDLTLLKRALKTMILLAMSFSRDKNLVRLTGVVEPEAFRVQVAVDDLSLSAEQVADFFKIESTVRSATSAESLGLAPVAAHKIVSAFGGEMRLVTGEGNTGYCEVVLLRELDEVPPG
jgi:DNA-binding response OmpR family regulator